MKPGSHSLLAWLSLCLLPLPACSRTPAGGASVPPVAAVPSVTAVSSVAPPIAAPPVAPSALPATPAEAEHHAEPLRREACFTVISKRHLVLAVYEVRPASGDTLAYVAGRGAAPVALGPDTVLIARYPVCLSRELGQKKRSGDMRTPESPAGRPFEIVQIQDASTWRHDFGDGRGSFLAYGHWFHRLKTPGFTGIGIHGSTGNEHTVPGRDSEGCIRMRDADLDDFHDRYAYLGMPVAILGEADGPQPFEVRAMQQAAAQAHAPAHVDWLFFLPFPGR